MKKVFNSKVLGATALAVISPTVVNVANAAVSESKNVKMDEMSYGHPNCLKVVGDNVISNKNISAVYSKLVAMGSKDRSIVANKMRTDFQGFMNDYFIVNEGENYCLSRTWKTDSNCLKFIDAAANALEKGVKLNSFNLDEVGLNTIPYAKRQPAEVSISTHTDTSTGVTTIDGTIKWHL